MLPEPYIPQSIRVHLGTPDSDAETITVPFSQYIKNVASSELYPTWPENALRANIYAIITFALNRLYTEWYPSKGYDFDITNNTQYDQKYIQGRDIFENISQIVDEIFNEYIVRQGYIEPIFAAFCDGHNVICEGLSQWGTVDLANEGKLPYEILQNFYGDNIDIISAPVRIGVPSYPGTPLQIGDSSNDVAAIQLQLNRISRNYPAIPKIPNVNGIFDGATQDAVKEFQQVFNLPVTGIVDRATWYKIGYIYTSVKRLAELGSEGITPQDIAQPFVQELHFGMQAPEVSVLQYYLSVLAAYYDQIESVPVTGYYGDLTEKSVKSFQKLFGYPQTGNVDMPLFNEIYHAYLGIVDSVPINLNNLVPLYPGKFLTEGVSNDYVKLVQQYLSFINQYFPDIPAVNDTGYYGPLTRASVIAFQKHYGIDPSGVIGSITWDKLASVYSELKYGEDRRVQQFPGFTIT